MFGGETEIPPMDWDKMFCFQVAERAQGVQRSHVDFLQRVRVVGSDRQESDIGLVIVANLLKKFPVCRIAAEKNRSAVFSDDIRIVASSFVFPKIPFAPMHRSEGGD